MRQNRGSVIFLALLMFTTVLFAEAPYRWTLKSTKQSVYVNEAVEVEFRCDFVDQGYLHVIEFTPEKDTLEYRLLPLGVIEKTEEGRRSDIYRYVLFPKRAGEKVFRFEALMRETTKASIENSVIGRDNVEDYAFDDTRVELPPLVLNVKPHQEKMTGRFTLDVTLDKTEVRAYEPVHLDIHVRGEGDFDQMQEYNLSIEGVKVFSEPAEKRFRLGPEGFKGEWEQKFSLVASKDFTVAPITLSYFDIDRQRRIVLRSERFDVTVEAAYMPEELLDDVEEDGGDDSWWSWWYLNYLFTFVTGLYLGHRFAYHEWHKKVPEGFDEEVAACRSVSALLLKLILSEDERYNELIQKYERLGKKASLTQLKREVLALGGTIMKQKGKDVE